MAAKRNLHSVPPQNQMLTDPGDNTRFLNHVIATKNQPPIDITDVKQVEARLKWYFNHCAEDDIKPTVNGFANALGVTRQTILNWKTGTFRPGTHQAVILEAYAMLEELWEHYLQNGKMNPISAIFLGKNHFSYVDKQDLVVSPNNSSQPIDVTTIEAKYAELPDYRESAD